MSSRSLVLDNYCCSGNSSDWHLHLLLLHPRQMCRQGQHTSIKEIKWMFYFNFLICSFFDCCINLCAKSPGIQDQQQEEVELTTEESSSELAASNKTIQSSYPAAISVYSGSTIDDFVLLKGLILSALAIIS